MALQAFTHERCITLQTLQSVPGSTPQAAVFAIHQENRNRCKPVPKRTGIQKRFGKGRTRYRQGIFRRNASSNVQSAPAQGHECPITTHPPVQTSKKPQRRAIMSEGCFSHFGGRTLFAGQKAVQQRQSSSAQDVLALYRSRQSHPCLRLPFSYNKIPKRGFFFAHERKTRVTTFRRKRKPSSSTIVHK